MVVRAGKGVRVTADGDGASFRLMECSGTGYGWWLHSTVNVPDVSALGTFSEWSVGYVTDI